VHALEVGHSSVL